ncbi:hypothetical protein OG474_00635 [Kribbella sp. NBC_01505]|uniref:hypothetical protein n=1 Tax=Kribbella sp. NBC_01505 TaxID=2903580 RepID=UPI003866A6E9
MSFAAQGLRDFHCTLKAACHTDTSEDQAARRVAVDSDVVTVSACPAYARVVDGREFDEFGRELGPFGRVGNGGGE